jgi:hypothetical protein
MEPSVESLVQLSQKLRREEEEPKKQDVITVSETVSVAVSAYETVRNTLEYDEVHLLRRNAIRRFLKRRVGEVEYVEMATDLLRELIWARYLPNKQIPESRIKDVVSILKKYEPLFGAVESSNARTKWFEWLLDVISTEIEYAIAPPLADEALASYAYKEIGKRLEWNSKLIPKKDQDLQLYLAVHRAVLKSNIATLRFRALMLYYPEWSKAKPSDPIVREIAQHFVTVAQTVEAQLTHPGSEPLYRTVRKVAVVFHVMRDLIWDDPEAFSQVVNSGDGGALDAAISKAATARYNKFHKRLRRSVLRAVLFLFLTKFIFAILIELPYERFILKTEHYTPLLVNIIFHPLFLGVIGLSVRIPEKKNTAGVQERIRAMLGLDGEFAMIFKARGNWSKGKKRIIFQLLYLVAFLFSVGVIATTLWSFNFNSVSILFFLFFLSLVSFMGLKIRNTRRELLVVDAGGGFIGTIVDVLFLPITRAGRWLALRAPRVNVFLFFLDFIIEAPFKAAFSMIEGWLAFLKEKKEEI